MKLFNASMELVKADLYKRSQGSTVGAVPDEADCRALKPDPSFNATVAWHTRSSSCEFSCKAKDSLACMACPDRLRYTFAVAGMPDNRSTCNHTIWPSEERPELSTQVCPEWKLVLNYTGAQGKPRVVNLSMYTDSAVKA